MMNKTVIISAILGVLLVGSIVGTVILVNQYSKAKESLSGIENELSTAQTELDTAKATLEDLEVTYNELSLDTSIEMDISGDSILESGVTMDEAYHMVEVMKASGQLKDYLSEMVKKLGTSLEAIEKYGETIETVQQPSAQEPSQGNQGGGQKPSNQQPANNNDVPDTDSDGDGYSDSFSGGQGNQVITDGSGSGGGGSDDYELDTH
ncbi:hypothetical protein [Candidatus Formimonas warabiya]|uniref:Uncharacterized protein n=1 Tax=Formimonas warabiya TaxID=1761012 RepID=A0A3G1KT38_FORW1|nr:hypothetical protein [Candidatus Formimonas warabiya]ATW25628.1 hypothetical protein DCMF_13430 [Candidatus Formimonas warabiya]